MQPCLPIAIRGTGSYVPAEVLDNKYFESRLDTSDEWILTRTGIRERRRAAPNECTSTMGAEAARRALADARLSAKDIDVIICATATGDHPFPATATFIQAHLGIADVPAFDIAAACAGFLYATVMAASLLGAGLYRRALVIGAETLTRYADSEDRRTVVLFGDAAGAAVIERSEEGDQGILHCELGCDGTRAEHILVPAGGSRLPTSEKTIAERLGFLRMRGPEVYKFAVLKMQELIDRALATLGLSPGDVAMIIPHQSNLRIIESVRERLGLPPEKIPINIDRYGNTSAASVIMALDEARRGGKLKRGDIVGMIALGAGLTWSSLVMRL